LFRELKQKEEVLLKAKNEWETTFDSVPDLIAIIDPNHKIARLNKPMAARLGLEPKQCIGLPCYEAVHGLTGPIASCPHARSLADGKEHVQEVFEPRLDGYFLVSTTPLYNKKGQILGCVHMARDITERKKTEEKLSYLASFPQLNMNPIIEIEPGTGITYMNPAAETLFPRLRKELFNSALLAGINHDENHASRETLYENKAWLQSIASLPEGKIRIYHTDITERKKWEEELKETQNYLESLIGYANAPIIVWDKNNKITKFNRAFEYMTGYTANDVIGQDLSILFPPESRQMALEEIAKTTAGKFLHSVEIPILRKNGKTKIALWNSANIYDKDGQTLMATIAQGQDITARIQLEKRVSAHARYLEHEKVKSEAILSSIGHGIVAIDNERKTLFSNEGFENITGYSKKELLGQDITQFIRLEDEKGIEISAERRPIRSVLLSGKKTNSNSVFSFNCIRKDGSKIPVAITTTPIILDNKVIGAIEVYRDITREKQIDRAKTEFVSLASHQLRTPLASINLAAEMLMNGIAGELSKEQRKYLRTIRGSIKEMAELIETLLNVSRIESGALTINPEPTSLPNFITASLKDFSIQIEDKRLNLIKEFDQDIPILNIDRKLMQLILDNLISNAIKYTKEKDTISVTAKKSRHAVVISVSDTGYGIPSHQHSQIFTKLFRADNHLKSQTKGTGLGLYIVKACVAQYGGKVWFESEENKGTTFYVTVPLIGMKKRDKVQQNLFPVTL
jgi:PAS domain S-box-containing protein